MKVWLDDLRTPPDDTWVWVKGWTDLLGALSEADQATDERIAPIEIMSFDHDLGLGVPDGYDIVKWMAEKLPSWYPLEVRVHSANPIGSENIRAFDKNWREHGQTQQELR